MYVNHEIYFLLTGKKKKKKYISLFRRGSSSKVALFSKGTFYQSVSGRFLFIMIFVDRTIENL